MSAPSNAAEKSALNVPDLSQGDSGDDPSRKWETKEPGLLPARNSSLPRTRKASDTTSDLNKEKMEPPREGLKDVLKKESEHPTLSTIGMSSVDEESQAPPVPAKKRDTTVPVVEEPKPTVTIAPDVVTDKETNGQPRILTPPLQPTSDESDDELG